MTCLSLDGTPTTRTQMLNQTIGWPVPHQPERISIIAHAAVPTAARPGKSGSTSTWCPCPPGNCPDRTGRPYRRLCPNGLQQRCVPPTPVPFLSGSLPGSELASGFVSRDPPQTLREVGCPQNRVVLPPVHRRLIAATVDEVADHPHVASALVGHTPLRVVLEFPPVAGHFHKDHCGVREDGSAPPGSPIPNPRRGDRPTRYRDPGSLRPGEPGTVGRHRRGP